MVTKTSGVWATLNRATADALAFWLRFGTLPTGVRIGDSSVAASEDRGAMTRRSALYRRLCLTLALGFRLLMTIGGPAAAEPIDACALPPTSSGTASAPVETATIARITGPNSVLTTTGREIRLASVTTPRRAPPGPSTSADVPLPASEPISAPDDEIEAALNGSDETPDPTAPPDAPSTDPIATARSALGAWLTGQEVRLYPVTSKPDRYGRTRAAIARASDGLWIEAELVAQGLARVQPQTDDFGCARHLETVEAAARVAKRGLWALPEFAVIEADDATRDRWIGRYVLIEGKVVSLGTSGTRRYLNFGRNFSRDFAIVLVDKGSTVARTKEKRTPSRIQQEGFDAPTVVGKRILVRGILTNGGGGLILPSLPEEIEWVQDQP